uniref:Uncharacterized protein n=1 Tax=Strombidium inclinatum TaxID=197538 RepID=A0A7S3N4M2_9SPIT|mmetsp:Transcript_5522/g.8667  ORF Transcript_5522/g.8667 Transcript_5522/m.8667 type:complete len:151 (+) Transcript_5522:4551-5003(+)
MQDGKKSARLSNKGKTREELIEIRKKMLKEKFKDRQENNKSPLGSLPQETNTSGFMIPKEDDATEAALSARNQELMARLAKGVKVSVQKKEMKKLTKKNYDKLPEIIAKKEEAKKNEETMAKKKRYAEYQKELDQRLRNNLRKQREKLRK